MRVCQKWFPKGSYKGQRQDGFYMDDLLKGQIDILLKNIQNDWDFTLLITGGGEVRIGKSVLAMQIGAYWSYMIKELYNKKVPFSVETNFVLDGRKLIEIGNKLGQHYSYPCLIFDEAGADLEGRKVMTAMTQEVLDYYRECGQYNILNLLVLPEFFDLPKGIAMSRSICLIDVYCATDEEGMFQRGYFNFFSRRNKKQLWIKGKKELNYNAYKYNFHGRFYDMYPIDEKAYRKLKQDALTKRETKRRSKFMLQRDACWFLLNREQGLTLAEIGKRMEQLTGIFVPHNTISDGMRHLLMENE